MQSKWNAVESDFDLDLKSHFFFSRIMSGQDQLENYREEKWINKIYYSHQRVRKHNIAMKKERTLGF